MVDKVYTSYVWIYADGVRVFLVGAFPKRKVPDYYSG